MNGVAAQVDTESVRQKILRKCRESMEMKEKFFDRYADKIETMCGEMARRFQDGGKLLVMGNGGSLCDALHLAVEFNHRRRMRLWRTCPPCFTFWRSLGVSFTAPVYNDHNTKHLIGPVLLLL
jgi:phosphoheptose isomerase